MEKIGRHYYNSIKNNPNLTDEQKKQIEEYENRKCISRNFNDQELEYLQKLKQNESKPEISFDAVSLYNLFKVNFEIVSGQKLILNDDSKHNLAALCLYFSKDERFFKCKHLTSFSKPSFDKGLLLIGSYGIGKSKFMETFRVMFLNNSNYSFKSLSANEVVENYENCNEPEDKKQFWKQVCNGRHHFGDVKTERIANNYGKTNLFKDVIEKRYENNVKTYIDCNYDEGGNLETGLDEFGLKYGSRVYDRIPEMFNVIEFKGKSFRL